MRRAADDAPTLPFPVRSGRSGRRGARTFDAATNALLADRGDDRSTRSASTSAAERSAAVGAGILVVSLGVATDTGLAMG